MRTAATATELKGRAQGSLMAVVAGKADRDHMAIPLGEAEQPLMSTATSAADTELLKPDFATTESCVKQHIKTAPSYSVSRQIAESYCHR
jgi:hypothetical protein